MENFENAVVEETMETQEVICDELEEVGNVDFDNSEVSVETSEEDEKVGAGLVVGLVAGAGLAVYGGVKLVKDVAIPGCKKFANNVSAKLEEKKAAKEAKKLAKKVVIENVPEVEELEDESEEE